MKPTLLLALLLACIAHPGFAAELVPLKDLARHELYRDVKISPDGQYLAATAVVRDKTVLSLVRLADLKGANLRPQDRDDVVDFWWVGPKTVVFSVTERIFGLDGSFANGELYAIDADGSNRRVIYSFRRSQGYEGFADVIGKLGDTGKLLVDVYPSMHCDHDHGPYPTARSLDAAGHMEVIATAPICGASFVADNAGVVRFAWAVDEDQMQKVFYRANASDAWTLLFDEAKTKVHLTPLRFDRENAQAYFSCAGDKGVGGICRWNAATTQMTTLWSGTESGPEALISTFDERDAFAVAAMPGRPALTLLDKSRPEAQMLVTLLKSFPGQQVHLGEHTADGSKMIVFVHSDTNPGEFYLFEPATKKVTFLLATRPWIKPEQLAVQEPFDFKARDGTPLHGYVTRIESAEKRAAPTVVFVHGGPYEIRDRWGYDNYAQALATRGYAVVQVNFRGSGGYGDDFIKAGTREWGRKMQDDVTDATRWAIDKGIADPKRLCIFGASYGGYAALEGAVREPDLYRCAIGYVGVYDLRMMFGHGDIPRTRFGKNYLKTVLGEDKADLADRSPVSHADKIKAKVMLIVGGADDRVPDDHGRDMRAALRAAGADPEWLYDRSEGHGFYNEAHITELFEKMLAFLNANIGSGAAPAGASK